MYQHSLYTTHIVGQLGNAMNSYYLHVGGKITAIFYILSVVSQHGMSGPDGKNGNFDGKKKTADVALVMELSRIPRCCCWAAAG